MINESIYNWNYCFYIIICVSMITDYKKRKKFKSGC